MANEKSFVSICISRHQVPTVKPEFVFEIWAYATAKEKANRLLESEKTYKSTNGALFAAVSHCIKEGLIVADVTLERRA